MGRRFQLVGGLLWLASGALAVGAGSLALLERWESLGADEVVVPGPEVRVVRKCKAPEKGWCVFEVARLGEPVPKECECGPVPRAYASLLEPDKSWETLQSYRKQLRVGGARRKSHEGGQEREGGPEDRAYP